MARIFGPMKASTFEMELTKTGKIFGRDVGLRVALEGEGAYTDGEVIKLPAMGRAAMVSEEVQRVLRGLLDHEAGHVTFSDLAAWKRYVAKWKRKGWVLAPDLLNGAEDIRMEREVIKAFAGAKANLMATTASVNGELVAHIKEHGRPASFDQVWVAIASAVTWAGRRGYGEHTNPFLYGMLEGELKEAVDEMMAGLDKCKNTTDAAKLTERIYEKYGGPVEKQPEKPGQGEQGQPGEQGQEGQGEGSGEQENGNEGNEGQNSGGEQEGGEGQQEGGEGAEAGAGTGSGGRVPKNTAPKGAVEDGKERMQHRRSKGGEIEDGDPMQEYDPRISRHIEEVYKREGLQAGGLGSGYAPYSTAGDFEVHAKMSVEEAQALGCGLDSSQWGSVTPEKVLARLRQGTQQGYESILRDMQGDVNVLRAKLMRALMSQERRGWEPLREEGRLDSKRLINAVRGEKTVWKQPSHVRAVNTAVYILVDHSGSMTGEEIDCAQQCTVALAEALDPSGVKTEITGYTAALRYDGKAAKAWEHGRPYALGLYRYKAFDEPTRMARPAMAQMRWMAGGYTPSGCGVQWAMNKLMARDEPRKILLLMTDGRPEVPGRHSRLVERRHAKESLEFAKSKGIETFGIGIMEDVSPYFEEGSYVNVQSVNELATTGIQMLAKALLGKALRVAA